MVKLATWDGSLRPRPEPVRPMEPVLRPRLRADERYAYEVKWDGIRVIAWLADQQVAVHTRDGLWCEEKYPELSVLAQQFEARQAVLDGELVTLVQGRPSFHAMMVRHLRRSAPAGGSPPGPLLYVAFDLLALGGRDLRSEPWERRTALLDARLSAEPPLHRSPPRSDGAALMKRVRQQGMEGIVAKRRRSPYHGGRSHEDWYKVKVERVGRFTIGGFRAAGTCVRSLLLGEAQPQGRLQYVGRVGSGIDSEAGARLYRLLQPSAQAEPPFGDTSQLPTASWVAPIHVCRVRYLMKTRQQKLRHPVFVGMDAEGQQ